MTSVAHLIRRRRARRHRQRKTAARRRTVTIGGLLLVLLLVVLPVGGAATIGLQFYAAATASLPAPRDTIAQSAAIGPSLMTDRAGDVLLWSIEDPLGDERAWITLDALPDYVPAATLLAEDPDFLEERTPPLSLAVRRMVDNYFYGPLAPDATLAGRLVRNTLSPADRAAEFALVAEVNRRHSREEVLEWHLNTNYYGNDAYGIDAAARIYFGKSPVSLTLDEAALLAAIPTAPQYNPVDDIEAARGRQAALLRELFVNDAITQAAYNTANATVTEVRPSNAAAPAVAPSYALFAREQAEDLLDSLGYDGARLVSRGGLRIVTALDVDVQEQARCTLENHLLVLNGGVPTSPDVCVGVGYLPTVTPAGANAPDSGAVVVINAQSGELVAAVGDVTADDRQPGAVLHPFVYMAGFSSAFYTPATMVYDTPQRFPGAADGLIYTPENPDGRYLGPVNLRDAMGAGRLPPVVQVANTQGLDNILRTARLMGMEALDTTIYDLSLLERGGGVSVLDATYAYSVFATLGEMRGVQATLPGRGEPPRQPVAVLRIEDAAGDPIWDYEDERALSVTPILDDGLAFLVNNILSDTEVRSDIPGTSAVLSTTRPAAVVTGPAGGESGAWAVGYSPSLAVGVWVGAEDGGSVTLDPTRITGAAPVWRALMEYSHDRFVLGPEPWTAPDNIVEGRVCERSGLRPNGACPERTEIFLENTQPPDQDTYWQQVAVNTQTNLLATANTPSNFRDERRFFVPPPEVEDWWAANQPSSALLPQQYDTITRPDAVSSALILRPELFEYVSGEVDIRGSMDGENLSYYQLAYGQGLNPTEWIDIAGQREDYVPGNSLGTWDTSDLDGLYNLRLTAVLRDNSIDPYIVQVTVDNVAPTVELAAGEPGRVFTFLDDDVVPLTATVEDNVAIDRVEFYFDGEFVGTDESFPYGYDHNIVRIGPLDFRAVVFDAAGNSSAAELTVEVLRGGT